MPNWVENTIEIKSDDASKLSDILNKVRNFDEDSGKEYWNIARGLFPLPEEIDLIWGTGNDIKWCIDKKTGEKRHLEQSEFFLTNMDNDEDKDYDLVLVTDEEKEALMEKYGATDWYDWNNKTYGTKWGDCDTVLVENESNKIIFSFDTAWSPSYNLSEKISSMLEVEIVHKYWSAENGDEGGFTFDKNGRCIAQWWQELRYDEDGNIINEDGNLDDRNSNYLRIPFDDLKPFSLDSFKEEE